MLDKLPPVQAIQARPEVFEKSAGLQEVRNARELGRLIEMRRKALGYGLVDTAALCGVGTRFLAELEHGKSTVEFDRALRVASRLGLKLSVT